MTDRRVKCGRCRRWMRRHPTVATPVLRARPPHDKVCVDCAPATRPFRPVSPGQISALHAKCNTLQRLTLRPAGVWKDEVKAAAIAEFALEPEFSFREISYDQASWCLDWLNSREIAATPELARA